MNPYENNYKWNGKWRDSEHWLVSKTKDGKDDRSQWLLENTRPKLMMPETISELMGYGGFDAHGISTTYGQSAPFYGPYYPDGQNYKLPVSPSEPIPPSPPYLTPLNPTVPCQPNMGLDSINTQMGELRNLVFALQKTILEQQKQLTEEQEKNRQMEEEVKRISMTKVTGKQPPLGAQTNANTNEDTSWLNMEKLIESFAKQQMFMEMMKTTKETVLKEAKETENIDKEEKTTKNETVIKEKSCKEAKVKVDDSNPKTLDEKQSLTIIKKEKPEEKIKEPMSPPGRKEAKQASIKLTQEGKKRSKDKKVQKKDNDESKESLHKQSRSGQALQKRRTKKSFNKKDELEKHVEDLVKLIKTPVTVQKVPSDGPTVLIAPDDYEHIFSAQTKNAIFIPKQPTKNKQTLPMIPSDAPTALIGPEDYEHIYSAPKKKSAKQALPQIPSDAPTALIAPCDYEHIYCAKKESDKNSPKPFIPDIPENGPTALIAPDDNVHTFHKQKKIRDKTVEQNCSKNRLNKTVEQNCSKGRLNKTIDQNCSKGRLNKQPNKK